MSEEQDLEEKAVSPATTEGAELEIQPEDEGPKRFVSKGPWVVHDTMTDVYWLKKDSWQDKGKFYNWHEARDYADNKNMRKIGGFDDWRIPTSDEAATLYDETFENVGKSGETLRIDKVFPEGSFKVEWTMADTSTKRPRFDYTQGKIVHVEEYSFGSVRVCRRDVITKDDRRTRGLKR